MVSVQSVSKRYGKVQALKEVSFDVPKGQVLGLLGQNGAGKTSLLNLMAGYLPCSEGWITINGHDLLREPLQAKAEIGYLPEVPPLYPEMKVTEYLRFCCELKGVVKGEHVSHVDELIELCGLQSVRHRLAGLLSKGFRQRLGLAQALCGAPQLILLDEPTAGFDPSQAAEFRSAIKSLTNKHTIVFSSHILSEVQAICDRVLIIHEGRLVYDQMKNGVKKQETQRFRLRVKGEGETMLPAIRGLGSVLRIRQDARVNGGFFEASVEVRPEGHFQEELFHLLGGLNAPILMLVPLQDSMEDVFLRMTARGSAAELVP